jgi:hypothetical protein
LSTEPKSSISVLFPRNKNTYIKVGSKNVSRISIQSIPVNGIDLWFKIPHPKHHAKMIAELLESHY